MSAVIELSAALRRRGIAVPEGVTHVMGGNRSLCLIGCDEVLKLFIAPPPAALPLPINIYITRSLAAYAGLSEVADQIATKGIAVPRQLAHGVLSQPMTAGGLTFLAWQRMTRVLGVPLSNRHKWLRPRNPRGREPKFLDASFLPLLAELAARLHVPVTKIQPRPLAITLKNAFAGVKKDGALTGLLAQLGRDVQRFTAGHKRCAVLHHDLHAHNVLHGPNGYGVIDWDEFDRDWPELDLFFMGIMPTHLHRLCEIYNKHAAQRVDPRLVAIVSYVVAIRDYQYTLSWQGNGAKGSSKGRELRRTARRVNALGQEVSRMTGKKIYTSYAVALTKA